MGFPPASSLLEETRLLPSSRMNIVSANPKAALVVLCFVLLAAACSSGFGQEASEQSATRREQVHRCLMSHLPTLGYNTTNLEDPDGTMRLRPSNPFNGKHIPHANYLQVLDLLEHDPVLPVDSSHHLLVTKDLHAVSVPLAVWEQLEEQERQAISQCEYPLEILLTRVPDASSLQSVSLEELLHYNPLVAEHTLGQTLFLSALCVIGWFYAVRFLWRSLQHPLIVMARQEGGYRKMQEILARPASRNGSPDAQAGFLELMMSACGAVVLAPILAGLGAIVALVVALFTADADFSLASIETGASWGAVTGCVTGFLGIGCLTQIRASELNEIRNQLRTEQAKGIADRNSLMLQLWTKWEQKWVEQAGWIESLKRRAVQFVICSLTIPIVVTLLTVVGALCMRQSLTTLLQQPHWLVQQTWFWCAASAGLLMGVIVARELTARLLFDCPFDTRSRFRRWPLTSMPGGKDYDVFISYKTEDAALAREIGEALLARGATPWFAEFVIGLDNDEEVNRRLADGVRRSRFGLLLTNGRWGASQYCRDELVGLLAHAKPGRLIQIKCPDEALGPPAEKLFDGVSIPGMIYENDLNQVLGFISSQTGLISAHTTKPVVAPAKASWHALPHGRIDVANWDRPQLVNHPVHGKVLQGESRQADGRLWWNIVVQERPDWTPRPAPQSNQMIDDREWLQQVRQYAQEHTQTLATHCRGYHLLFKDGYSHQGTTYSFAGAWIRRYSIVLPVCESDTNVEFCFVFRFLGPFRNFMKHTQEMEALVMSLQVS